MRHGDGGQGEVVRLNIAQVLRVGNLLQRFVGTDRKRGLAVRRDGDASVAARFEDVLAQTLAREGVPLVHGTVHSARHDLLVIHAPDDRLDLAVVTF